MMLRQSIVKILFPVILGLFIVSPSCKKYREDGKYCLQTASDRIKTFWILKECIVDGKDVMYDEISFVYDPDGQNITKYYKLIDSNLEFKYYVTKVGGTKAKHYKAYLTVYSDKNSPIVVVSNYSFADKKNKLQFNSNYTMYSGGSNNLLVDQPLFFNLSNEPWEIIKLTDKELRLKVINSFGQEIRLKFNER